MAFLAEEVLGIKNLEPECKKIAVKPDLKIDSPKEIEVITE